MGMSIDEAISHLGTYSSTMGSGQTTQEQHEEAKRVARDTIRKYQKIQEIVNIWSSDTGKDNLSGEYYLRDIRGVLDNGNDD